MMLDCEFSGNVCVRLARCPSRRRAFTYSPVIKNRGNVMDVRFLINRLQDHVMILGAIVFRIRGLHFRHDRFADH